MSQVVFTVNNYQGNKDALFNEFVKEFLQADLMERGTRHVPIEYGPREHRSTVFHVNIKFTTIMVSVNFVDNGPNIDVVYDVTSETDYDSMDRMQRKLTMKMDKKAAKDIRAYRDALFIPVIQASMNKALNKSEASSTDAEDPIAILKRRFACGEITEEEFLSKKKLLEE